MELNKPTKQATYISNCHSNVLICRFDDGGEDAAASTGTDDDTDNCTLLLQVR